VRKWSAIGAPAGLYERIIASLNPDNGVAAPTTITWDGKSPCPVEVGEEISLRRSKAFDPDFLWHEAVPSVWIKIRDVTRGKKGEHVAAFIVVDHRPRYLARGIGVTTNASEAIDREADYDQGYAEQLAVTARLRASESASERESAYRSFRESLKDTRRDLAPYADVALLAELRRVLNKARRGELDD
jgi:hypothetical protein